MIIGTNSNTRVLLPFRLYAQNDDPLLLQSAIEFLPADKESATIDVSRCNIPGVENNASSSSSSQLSSSPTLPSSLLSCEADVVQGGVALAPKL